MRLAWVATTLLCCAACADQTAIVVEVSSTDLHVPADIDTLHFDATTPSGLVATGDYRITSPLPQSLAIRAAANEPAERVTVVVTASHGSATVARGAASGMLVAGTTTRLGVTLVRCTTDCTPVGDGGVEAGVDLGPDVVDLGSGDGGLDLAASDLGMDAAADLGPPDLGVSDLGPPDLGAHGSCTTGGCATHLVISELATGGPATGTDEFVEIYNPTSAPIDASGLVVEYKSAAASSWSTRATLPAGTTIPAYSFYLVASMGYSSAVTPDPPSTTMPWTTGFAAAAGHVHIALGGVELDRIGWGATASMPEGTAAPGFSSDSSRSYERRAFSTSDVTSMTTGADATYGNSLDTDDNATDFVIRPMRQPQNSASPPETP